MLNCQLCEKLFAPIKIYSFLSVLNLSDQNSGKVQYCSTFSPFLDSYSPCSPNALENIYS